MRRRGGGVAAARIFTLDVPIYDEQLLVAAGASRRQLRAFLQAEGARASFTKRVLAAARAMHAAADNGLVLRGDRGMAMLLRPYVDEWRFWELLVHETHHYVRFVADKRGMAGEAEALAHLQQWLVREIRRRLQGCGD